jgi:sugar phosphate isomerase/epimerase
MEFGVCGGLEVAAVAARESYDYMEWTVASLLLPREPENAFRDALNARNKADLPYPVANGFVPGDLKITGPDVDDPALQAYVATTMARAERAGIEVIVFGSGGARRIPDGFDAHRAHAQLVTFCRMVGPLARDHGVTVAVEPLNSAECNVLTTLDESAGLVREVADPAIRLLVDAYHLMREDDSFDAIVAHGDLLVHAHIATEANRRPPGVEPCDFSPFFAALARARYTGRVSIESRVQDLGAELPVALVALRELVAD